MSRVMFDSTNINDIPTTASMVAYYIDGIYATTSAIVRARFPHAVLVPISAVGTDNGLVGDVEPGCMTVPQGVTWVQMRRLANADPTIYCNEMNAWAGIRQAFHNAGVVEPHYWVADYDNIAVLPAGAIAKQYANPTLTGGHYDKSIVADFWPGVDTPIGDDMTSLRYEPVSGAVYIVDASGKRHIFPPENNALKAELGAAYKLVNMTAADLATIPDAPTAAVLLKAIAAIPAGPQGLPGTDGKDGAQGPAGVVPDHHHIVSSTSTMVP